MFVLSRGRRLLVYVLMEYHQVTAQPVVGLSGGLNSCQKTASLASKAPVRFLILSSVVMLGCGSCCLGLRRNAGGVLALGWNGLSAPKSQRSFWQAFCWWLHCFISWWHDFLFLNQAAPQLYSFQNTYNWGKKWFLSSLATSQPAQHWIPGLVCRRVLGLGLSVVTFLSKSSRYWRNLGFITVVIQGKKKTQFHFCLPPPVLYRWEFSVVSVASCF